MSTDWISIIASIISGLFFFYISRIFKETKDVKLKLALLLISFNIICNFLSSQYLTQGTTFLTSIGIIFINISVLAKKSILSTLGRTAICIVTVAIVDILFGILIISIGMDPIELKLKGYIYLPMNVMLFTIEYFILNSFFARSKNRSSELMHSKFNKEQKISVFMFIIMTVAILAFNTFFLSVNNFFKDPNNLFIVLILYFLYIFAIVRFISTNRTLTDKTEEFEQLKFYTDLVEGLIDDSNKFKHDYNNVLVSFSGYLRDRDYKGLDNYFEDLVDINNQLAVNNIAALKGINDSGIKGLITMKINQIIAENIDFDLEVHDDIDFSVGTLDLSRIIGVFLDNAKEAAMTSNAKKVKLGILNEDGDVSIFIANTYKDKPILGDIFKQGFSSKGNSRGFGLSNVKEIIDSKYSNVSLNTYFDEEYFVQEMIL